MVVGELLLDRRETKVISLHCFIILTLIGSNAEARSGKTSLVQNASESCLVTAEALSNAHLLVELIVFCRPTLGMAALILSGRMCAARRHILLLFCSLLLLNQSADQSILTGVRLGRTLRMALDPVPAAAAAPQTVADQTAADQTAADQTVADQKSLTPGKGSVAAAAAEPSVEAWVLVQRVGSASADPS